MARAGKTGIDYFSHDVDMLQDKKIMILKAKHGLIGYAVFLRLLEELYRENYYLKADEDFNVLFADANNIALNVYIEVLNVCINKGLFNKKLYDEYSILTSKRIQLNFISATLRRKEVEFIEEYMLVSNPEEFYNKTKLKTDVNIIALNANINPLNDSDGTQSKVKGKEIESKVEESNEEDILAEPKGKIPYAEIQEEWNEIGLQKLIKMTDKRKKKIKTRWEQFGDIDSFKEAFKKIKESDFCNGKSNKGWKATFDWLIDNDTNMAKVLEGNYDNRDSEKKIKKEDLNEDNVMDYLFGGR